MKFECLYLHNKWRHTSTHVSKFDTGTGALNMYSKNKYSAEGTYYVCRATSQQVDKH